MGLRSRRKGTSREYQLRDILRLHGWRADRVPSSGAAQGFKGDIAAIHPTHGPKKFEVKARKGTFDKIYQLYADHIVQTGNDLFSFSMGGEQAICVDLSSSLEAVLRGPEFYAPAQQHPSYDKFKLTFRKLHNAQKMLQGSDILVLKGDRQPFLYVRYR